MREVRNVYGILTARAGEVIWGADGNLKLKCFLGRLVVTQAELSTLVLGPRHRGVLNIEVIVV
jgi:hypothetical protein